MRVAKSWAEVAEAEAGAAEEAEALALLMRSLQKTCVLPQDPAGASAALPAFGHWMLRYCRCCLCWPPRRCCWYLADGAWNHQAECLLQRLGPPFAAVGEIGRAHV